MIDEKMVVHASDNPTVPFLDGYFIYCMPNKEGEEGTYTSVCIILCNHICICICTGAHESPHGLLICVTLYIEIMCIVH